MITTADAELTTLITMVVIYLLVSLAFYAWYGFALSKVFGKLGVEPWKAWVPILNEATVFARGGVPAWSVVFYFIPVVNLYALYLRFNATARINAEFNKGTGFTVLGVLLAPVWATILAVSGQTANSAASSGRADAAPAPAPAAPVVGTPTITGQAASSARTAPTEGLAAPAAAPAPAPVAAPAAAIVAPVPSAAPAPPAPAPAPVAKPAPAVSAPPSSPAPAADAEPKAEPVKVHNPWSQAPTAEPAAAAPTRPASNPLAGPPASPTITPLPPAPAAAPASAPAPVISAPPVAKPDPTPVTAAVITPPPPAAPAAAPATPAAPPAAPAATAPAAAPDTALYDDDEDDDGETIVVDRRPRIRWTLNVDGAGPLPLPAQTVLLGRKPTSTTPDVHALAVPDTTRTLSKVHARLDFANDAWTITDLNSTNGVVIIEANGSETLLEPGTSAAVKQRFILGEVGMSIEFEDLSS